MAKKRIDVLLAERGLAESREKARALIMAGEVRVDDKLVDKPGTLIPEEASISVLERPPYVSRGGAKLAHALDEFGLDVRGLVAADIGASTGGFTDCLLQRGARRVYAVDVGTGQLDYRIRMDPRIVVMEGVNARYLTSLPEPTDLATIDVSFISVEKIIAPIARLLKPGGLLLVLIKPQFEAGRRLVGKGGVVRDPAVHATVLGRIVVWAVERGHRLLGLTPSPILGPAGNREFFILLKKERDH